jgi:hypothetical protein
MGGDRELGIRKGGLLLSFLLGLLLGLLGHGCGALLFAVHD